MIASLKRSVKRLLLALNRHVVYVRPGEVSGLSIWEDIRLILGGQESPVVLDVGAHRGESIIEILKIAPGAHIYAFEPDSANIEFLSKRFSKTVRIFPYAVGREEGYASLHRYERSEFNSLLPIHKHESNQFKTQTPAMPEEVRVIALDSFCRNYHIEQIDLLKVDTQGFELEVLKGAGSLINEGRVKIISIEVNYDLFYNGQAKPWELDKCLELGGYRLVDIYEINRKGAAISWCTALFLQKEHLENKR
jgi:FkbM family methyltransferase